MNNERFDEYCLAKKGVEKDFKVEWGWTRYLIRGKMFAVICRDKEGRDIFTLKSEPMFGQFLRDQYEDIVPGYYMNKEHWNSVYVEGNVPGDVVKQMIDKSYELVLQTLSKKVQKEIEQG